MILKGCRLQCGYGLNDVILSHTFGSMREALLSIRGRLDRAGVLLSGFCAVHCLLSLLIISTLGLGSHALLAPSVHKIGLLLAVLIGAVTLGIGVVRHGRRAPLILGSVGLALMACAVAAAHGAGEAVLTIAGVALVAAAHIGNLRHGG